jgi:O-antigen ligase
MTAARARARDAASWLAALAAATVPLSTSVSGAAIAAWTVAALLAFERERAAAALREPAAMLPLALVAFAALSLAWTSAPLGEGARALTSYLKLLAIPLLLITLDREGARRVALAFLAANLVVLALSTGHVLWPAGPWRFMKAPGILTNDYATQSLQFTLCAFGLAHVAADELRRRPALALAAALLAAAFVANVLFVVAARTTFLVVLVLAALFVAQRVRRPGLALGGAALALALAAGIVMTSDYARQRLAAITQELDDAERRGALTSSGYRAFFWREGAGFVAAAPVLGHGVGATRALYAARVAETGTDPSNVTADPHSQALFVAIHLGAAGLALLFAVWLAHAALFLGPGRAERIGLGVVAQFVVSSAVNSHLAVYTLGWIYVFAVGAMGAAALARRSQRPGVPMPSRLG